MMIFHHNSDECVRVVESGRGLGEMEATFFFLTRNQYSKLGIRKLKPF